MNTFFIVLGAVGSIASIVGLVRQKNWLLHFAYVACVAVIAYFAVEYRTENERLVSTQREAASLIEDRRRYSAAGFIYATLAFLDRRQPAFRDTYDRAKATCEKTRCLDTTYESATSLDRIFTQRETADAMEGLLRSIARMNDR
jgi:hypothetical protein